MTFALDLAAAYEAQAETVTVDGVAVRAFFDGGYAETMGAAGRALGLRCVASTVAGVAPGDAVVRGAENYTVREVQPIGPDELETYLVLEKA